MSVAKVDVVVDGVLEQSFTTADETFLAHWAHDELDDCTASGVLCEIFVHDVNCCAQPAANHQPWWSNRSSLTG